MKTVHLSDLASLQPTLKGLSAGGKAKAQQIETALNQLVANDTPPERALSQLAPSLRDTFDAGADRPALEKILGTAMGSAYDDRVVFDQQSVQLFEAAATALKPGG